MLDNDNDVPDLHARLASTARSRRAGYLKNSEAIAVSVGVLAALVHVGALDSATRHVREIQWLVQLMMVWLCASRLMRFVDNFRPNEVFREFLNARLPVPAIWLAGTVMTKVTESFDHGLGLYWSEIAIAAAAVVTLLSALRRLAAETHNSAVLLAGSFLIVIAIGTAALKLPACRASDENGNAQPAAEWDVALFTATSASCVTGLIVKPTGSYWSPTGHAVILCLFQIGGLGILTFGAFLAVLSGRRGLQFREARTLREMLDADSVQTSRRLLLTILLFTLVVEAIGAASLLSLWPELPLLQRIWHAVFHSVSAFCNAGFSLRDDGFQGWGTRWPVWGPVTLLIILGGLGFSVVHDLWVWFWQHSLQQKATPLFRRVSLRPRLSLHSKLVLWSTVVLLAGGALCWFVLESIPAQTGSSVSTRVADAWFQSVTFRTAGFNTVDHAAMQPATKLMAIFLMFVGAAPGSTGGGVKTVVFAITMLNIWAVFRGRDHVEIFGRSIPANQVSRSLSMIAVGIFIVLGTTALLTIFEREPDRFLDHMYEATSAFGTVGVSAGVTYGLSTPSRFLICAVMFLGRVGPITLLLAMASPGESTRYSYPEERVSLG